MFGLYDSAHSLIPRPSTPLVFDCLQYWKRSKTGGVEGLGTRLSACSLVITSSGQTRDVLVADMIVQ